MSKPKRNKKKTKINYQTKEDPFTLLIVDKINKRDSRITKSSKLNLLVYTILVLSGNYIFTLLMINFKSHFGGNTFVYLIVSFQLAFISSLFLLFFLSKTPPTENKRKDEFLWKLGKRIFFSKLIIAFFLSIWAILILSSGLIIFSNNIQPIVFFLTPIFYFLYFSIMIYVFYHPKAIGSLITTLGTLSYIIGLKGLGFIINLLYFTIGAPDLLILYLFINVIVLAELFRLFVFKGELNKVQENVLNIVKPDNLFSVLVNEYNQMMYKSKALEEISKLYKKLEKKEAYGVKFAINEYFIEEANKRNKSRTVKMLGVLIIVCSFFITSIGEGLIQDIFNDRIKVFLCDVFGAFC